MHPSDGLTRAEALHALKLMVLHDLEKAIALADSLRLSSDEFVVTRVRGCRDGLLAELSGGPSLSPPVSAVRRHLSVVESPGR